MHREPAYPNPFTKSIPKKEDFTQDNFLHPSETNKNSSRRGFHQQKPYQNYGSRMNQVWNDNRNFGGRPPPPAPTRSYNPPFNNPGNGRRPRFESRGGGFRGRGNPQQHQPRFRQNGQHNNYQDNQNKGQDNNMEGAENPWISEELLKLIKEKEELWDAYSKERTEESHRNFKIKRFEVNQAVNDAKILYYQKNPPQKNLPNSGQSSMPVAKGKKSAFYCDPCDKDCMSQEMLDEHNTEHITCKLDGCTYTAHAKLVMKHIELQHSTNLFHRIKGYDTPEEIEKWKDERRKNFPTPDNIVKKNLERAERKTRGESFSSKDDFPGIEVFRVKIVPEKDKPRYRRQGPEYQSDGDEDCKRNRGSWGKPSLSSFNKSPAIRLVNFYTDIEVNKEGDVCGITRETWMKRDNNTDDSPMNLKSTKDEYKNTEFNITDDECDDVIVQKNDQPEVNPPSVDAPQENPNIIAASSIKLNVLGLDGYGTASDSEDGEIKSDTESVNPPAVSFGESPLDPKEKSNIDSPLSSDAEAPDEVPAIISKELETSICSNIKQKNSEETASSKPFDMNSKSNTKRNSRKNKRQFPNNSSELQAKRIRRKYSLLQRLLAPDIRKEKNIVLQVCRFLVDRNFLDPDEPSTVPTPSKTSEKDNPKNPEI